METAISCISGKPIGVDESTGMIIYQSYHSDSGINYMIGMRELDDLLILEQIGEGTAVTFLCGIKIIRKSTKDLIADILVDNNIHYTRQTVLEMVRKVLFDIIVKEFRMHGKHIDMDYLYKKLSDILDKCYFEKSRKAAMDWAYDIGIIKIKTA
jgi:hypothetical protein